ncbi:tRNA pseudouridine32 synthase / 23S rRNA pseudouridine746 synthase [Paenimyroides ummariense]|uniref:tRNA pseudouridine32 synthase / 23S rRNA pseudouridine746 synthase n=1 Tax=Paenimyroides ummariense TaxID=913024 RepID=A0A1I4YCL7_9FLAO|nr:RluA family pseudouridine synthase [Paenimyroides ummariense]SFN35309.1 tRNA pseudouridine32 synthase / 23S rRNA pseudouridine746 synthase [Paenimyroides ummariense]
MNTNSAETPCFITFNEDVSTIKLPEKLNFPFYYDVHPLCEIAAEQVQHFLETNGKLQHNFGLENNADLLPIGKMFGVLIVENNGELGFLAAYSGKLANSNSVAFFVPPVFDMLTDNGYFLRKEEELNAINREIESLENNTDLKNLQRKITDLEATAKHEIDSFKEKIKINKKSRKEERLLKKEILSVEEYQKFEADLIKQSLYDKHLLKELTNNFETELNSIKKEISILTNQIEILKNLRKTKSNALQNWLFTNYTFLNAESEEKSLLDIFKTALHSQPPAGAGECCAPKLFQYAYKNNLKPIALAEFWWGQSPKSEVRKHKQFYPSCWGKCEPILSHMLKGLQVDENPFLQNPAKDKELEIIYDDPYLVVINKPAEFLSVPGINISDSVYERIKHRYPHATGPLIVHRLDMSTSGLMVLAKNKDTHENLQKQFIKRKVKKSYIALLDGLIETDSGKIELPLRVDLDDRPRQIVCYEYGKMGITDFKVLSKTENSTRIQYFPITGRTHQLRVHSAHKSGLNAPIKGDDLYGTKSNRLHLHAHTLEFFHPITKEWVIFKADPDF